jgi:hypothetical protein
MDEVTVLDWFQKVWKSFANSKEGIPYMILDEAPSHMTSNVKDAITKCSI